MQLQVNPCQMQPLEVFYKKCVLRCFTVWKVSIFGVILVRIFPHLDWIDTPCLSVFSPNAGNADQNNSEYGHFSRSVLDLHNDVSLKICNEIFKITSCDFSRFVLRLIDPGENKLLEFHPNIFLITLLFCIFLRKGWHNFQWVILIAK